MKKRFLSIMMALCLTLTLLPTAALAADEPVVLIKPDDPVIPVHTGIIAN